MLAPQDGSKAVRSFTATARRALDEFSPALAVRRTYAQWIGPRERALHDETTNRVSLPFAWGSEHLGLDNVDALDALVKGAVADSDAFFSAGPRFEGLRATQHERGRYWERRVFDPPPIEIDHRSHALALLDAPPADTTVLLGYVKSRAHLDWIESHHVYNLRAVGPTMRNPSGGPSAQSQRSGAVTATAQMLSAPFVLLYGQETGVRLYRVTGDVETWPREHMLSLGYPEPGRALYHCLPLERVPSPIEQHIARIALDQTRAEAEAPFSAPVCVTWERLLARQR